MSTLPTAGRQKNVDVASGVAHLPSTQPLQCACTHLAACESMHVLEQMGSCVLKRVPLALTRSRGGIVKGSFRIAYKTQYIRTLIFHGNLLHFQYLHDFVCECEIQYNFTSNRLKIG